MRRIGLFLILATLPACNTRSTGDLPPVDAGGHPMDATPGTDGGSTDAGHLADGAPVDAGDPGTDAGPTDGAISCSARLTALPPEAIPRCSAATFDCINGCIADAGSGSPLACVMACEAADTTPHYVGGGLDLNCASCLNYEQRRCIQDEGCETAVTGLDCCVAAHCPDGSCVSTTCMSEYMNYASCAMATASPCEEMPLGFGVAQCFPPTDGGT